MPKKLNGIGGWLGIFTIVLIINIAVLFCIVLLSSLGMIELASMSLLLQCFFIMSLTVLLILIILKKKTARILAIILLAASIGMYALSYIQTLNNILLIFIIVDSLWLIYFLKSERVKNTFVK